MSFGERYFQTYAAQPEDWLASYRRRRYFYAGIARALRRHAPQAAAIAEFGCGLGMFSYHLLQSTPELVLHTFDVSDYAVRVAREHLSCYPRVQVDVGDAQDTKLTSGHYDAVVSLDVVEHLPNPDRMLAEARRTLKPGGVLVFSTPNPASIGARVKRRRWAGVPQESVPSVERWFADRDATHVSIRSIGDWRRACTAAGFVCLRDGTDSLWDTPYVRGVPTIVQKLLLNGSQRILIPLLTPLPWTLGENYIGIWRKA